MSFIPSVGDFRQRCVCLNLSRRTHWLAIFSSLMYTWIRQEARTMDGRFTGQALHPSSSWKVTMLRVRKSRGGMVLTKGEFVTNQRIKWVGMSPQYGSWVGMCNMRVWILPDIPKRRPLWCSSRFWFESFPKLTGSCSIHSTLRSSKARFKARSKVQAFKLLKAQMQSGLEYTSVSKTDSDFLCQREVSFLQTPLKHL